MLVQQLLLGSAMVALCVAIHIAAMIILLGILKRHAGAWLKSSYYVGATSTMVVIVLGLLAAHTVEIWLWAALYIYLGEFPNMTDSLYFSTVTFTTLGYGDIVLTERWQLLSSLEAAGGILLFGLSTGLAVAAVSRIMVAHEVPQNDKQHG
ncbi:MAG: potassium channel family protein [Pseudomonadota bacterium]